MMLIKPAVIGITGGVGAGKSSVLDMLDAGSDCRIIIADEVAKKIQEPGQACYNDIVSLLGKEVLSNDGKIDRVKMAGLIYENEELREKVNGLIHPAVNRYIEEIIAEERAAKKREFLFIEAALLIECGYGRICDELWYVYAPVEVRKKRLLETRGYSIEKSEAIMKSQLGEVEFRQNCAEVIDNGGTQEELKEVLDELIKKKRREFFGKG